MMAEGRGIFMEYHRPVCVSLYGEITIWKFLNFYLNIQTCSTYKIKMVFHENDSTAYFPFVKIPFPSLFRTTEDTRERRRVGVSDYNNISASHLLPSTSPNRITHLCTPMLFPFFTICSYSSPV